MKTIKKIGRGDALQEKIRAFYERLIQEGLMTEVNQPIVDLDPYVNHRPIEAKGKPISEEIIEDRR